jgi:hypothetical protein
MKEQDVKDFVDGGYKTPEDGWHKCTFKGVIGFLPAAGQAGVDYQNERGFKTLKLPCVVDDTEDEANGGQVNVLVSMESGHKKMAGILACVGLWEAVAKKYPGPDVTALDPPIIEGIKAKLPEQSCMVMTAVTEKDGRKNANGVKFCSFKYFKEHPELVKGAAPAAGKGKGKGATEAAPAADGPAPW